MLWPGLAVGMGLVATIWPYRVGRFEERLDAIGSKQRWPEVEPTGWRLQPTQVFEIAIVFNCSILTPDR